MKLSEAVFERMVQLRIDKGFSEQELQVKGDIAKSTWNDLKNNPNQLASMITLLKALSVMDETFYSFFGGEIFMDNKGRMRDFD